MSRNGTPQRGSAHHCEPEGFDGGLAFDGDSWSGCLWEADLYDTEDPMPTVGEFLESARTIHGLDVTQDLAAWRSAGCPSAHDDSSAVLACLARAREAGHDTYDSDTRSYIFAKGERVRCEGCPECSKTQRTR